MITERFREEVEKGLGAVVILAGSGSDEPHIEKLVNSLKKYDIPFEVRVASAHKQSDLLLEILNQYDGLKGPLAYIAVAGGTDALSGLASYVSTRPVITCPPDHPNESGLRNPPGSSNVYVARPENAARFVAQMFSHLNPDYRIILNTELFDKDKKLREDDVRLQNKFADSQK